MAASRPSLSAVAKNHGCTGVGSAPPLYDRRFVEWAAKTIHSSFWAGAYYQQQRQKGATHQMAVTGPGIQMDTDLVPLLEITDSLQ